jgi:hypothetical protein
MTTPFKAAEHQKNAGQFKQIKKAVNEAAKPHLKKPPVQQLRNKQDWRKG